MKKGIIVIVVLLVVVCSNVAYFIFSKTNPDETISDEEVINSLIDSYKTGDYEKMKEYISADNPLNDFFNGMNEEKSGELAPAYKKLYENLKNSITYTAKAVEGKETWGTVSVTISMPNYSAAIHNSMSEALSSQVMNDTDSLKDMPSWLLKGVDGEAETVEETFELHVGNRDGNTVMDTNVNRKFFEMLCGGLEPYLDASVTTVTFPEGASWIIISQGDEIVSMINTENMALSDEYTPEMMASIEQVFSETYDSIKGVVANAVFNGEALAVSVGVDMTLASTYELKELGLISDRITAGSNGWLSLNSTVSSFTRQGAECKTFDFKNSSEASES